MSARDADGLQLLQIISGRLSSVGAAHEAKWIADSLSRCPPENRDTKLENIISRRLKGEPLAYIFGHWAFRDYELAVGPGVLIPRPETEELVEYALSFTEKSVPLMEKLFDDEGLVVADVAAGTGCIGLTFVADLLKDAIDEGFNAADVSKNIHLHFVELSPEARVYLERNIGALKKSLYDTQISIHAGPWSTWKTPRLDLLLSNPPYLNLEELRACDAGVTNFEPSMALMPDDISMFPDASGPYRELCDLARGSLAPGGFALFEIGPSQLNWCRETSKKHKDFDNVRLYKDMAGKERFFYLRKT